jgi:hypothetical protein
VGWRTGVRLLQREEFPSLLPRPTPNRPLLYQRKYVNKCTPYFDKNVGPWYTYLVFSLSQDSSFGIPTSYTLDCRCSIPGRRYIFLFHRVHICSEAHQISYPMGAGWLSSPRRFSSTRTLPCPFSGGLCQHVRCCCGQ